MTTSYGHSFRAVRSDLFLRHGRRGRLSKAKLPAAKIDQSALEENNREEFTFRKLKAKRAYIAKMVPVTSCILRTLAGISLKSDVIESCQDNLWRHEKTLEYVVSLAKTRFKNSSW